MAEWFVGPIMDKIINACFEYLEDQLTWQTDMKEALERLQRLHPKIQAVVVYASSQAQITDQNPALNRWLWQLRDAIDEADDLLDEFEYMKHEQQLPINMEETKVRSIMKYIKKIGKRALKIDPKLKRLEKVVQNLDKVSAQVSTFLHLIENTKQEMQKQQLELYKTRETGSLPKNDLIGRVKEKESVMKWLRNTTLSNEQQTHITSTTMHRKISILSIVGHGGMGKTTLLQHVYEDEMTNEFDLKMWVCVSNNFDAKKVIADMLEYLTKERPRLKSLSPLQESLKSAVKSKKFLLVLDDIWEEEEERDKSKWEDVLAPLAFGSLGSKILVTTRMDSVASMIAKVIKKKKEILRLEGLAEDECFQIIISHAFADAENLDVHHTSRDTVEKIAKNIVKKLSGSPLAAKVMGGVLSSCSDESRWEEVLNNDIGSHNGIISILRLSYTFLPNSLQNCFAFCCIFPNNHIFYKDDLVRMWIALGFIQPLGETLEDIGGRYFDVLVKKSFFDKFEIKYKINGYKIHDLLRELAQSVSAQEYLRVVSDKLLLIPKTIRHLSIETTNLELLKKIGEFKTLRSLYLAYYGTVDQAFVHVLTEIFKASRSIRLLSINNLKLRIIPEAIRYLIHLRYLDFSRTSYTLLPRSLSNLYHLQFLILKEKTIIPSLLDDFLPRDMNNLSNLRYLNLPWDVIPGMHGIGKLNSLQELNGFYVKNETGYRLEELEHMNGLRQLRIKHLENVIDAKEACSAKLYDKRNLTDLSLEWDNIEPRNLIDLDVKVFDNLKPHNNLKKLSIVAYKGNKSAIWMKNANLIFNLEYIKLDECLEWQTLPPFGQLPKLKSFYLDNMPKVKRLENKFHENDRDSVFPSLEVLHIKKLEALEDWFDVTADDCLFPCLIELYLEACPNLQELPSLPPKLKELEINNIGWKAFNWLKGISNCRRISIRKCGNLISLTGLQEVETTKNCQLILSEVIVKDPSVLLMVPSRSITSIQKLEIKENDELVSFPIEVEQWFLQLSSSLRELNFECLKLLQSLPSSLESLSSLKILCVDEVPQLRQLPDIPASLELLFLLQLESLQCLPSSLSTISSLKGLHLSSIPLLKSLPDLPPSLFELNLEDLENLDCLPSCLVKLSSLQELSIKKVPQLWELQDLPPSLCELRQADLENLNCLPSCLPSLSSLEKLIISNVSHLRELPDLPLSLCELHLADLENLDCLPSCLPSLCSLQKLIISNVSQLRELPDFPLSLCELHLADLENLDCLPSCLPSLCCLQKLIISNVSKLKELPDFPPFLYELLLKDLKNLNCLPSCLFRRSYLQKLIINNVPQLRELPDLPHCLCELDLANLPNLDCLPSYLPSLSCLRQLYIYRVPQLRELPDLPPSLKYLSIDSCHPELMERHRKF